MDAHSTGVELPDRPPTTDEGRRLVAAHALYVALAAALPQARRGDLRAAEVAVRAADRLVDLYGLGAVSSAGRGLADEILAVDGLAL